MLLRKVRGIIGNGSGDSKENEIRSHADVSEPCAHPIISAYH